MLGFPPTIPDNRIGSFGLLRPAAGPPSWTLVRPWRTSPLNPHRVAFALPHPVGHVGLGPEVYGVQVVEVELDDVTAPASGPPGPLAHLPSLEGGHHEHVEAPGALEDDVVHSVLTRLASLRREEVGHAHHVVVDLVVFWFELLMRVHLLGHCARALRRRL